MGKYDRYSKLTSARQVMAVRARYPKESRLVNIPAVKYAQYLGFRPIHIPNEGDMTAAQRLHVSDLGNKGGEPDFMLLEERCGYTGLVLEFKSSPDVILKKNGELRGDKKFDKQKEFIQHAYKSGKLAGFVWSFEMAKNILDAYADNNRQLAEKYIEKQRYISTLDHK